MAAKAVFGEDRANVPVELDLVGTVALLPEDDSSQERAEPNGEDPVIYRVFALMHLWPSILLGNSGKTSATGFALDLRKHFAQALIEDRHHLIDLVARRDERRPTVSVGTPPPGAAAARPGQSGG